MTGPEHYLESELLLEKAAVDARNANTTYEDDTNLILRAVAHATLALVAATARRGGVDEVVEWQEATS